MLAVKIVVVKQTNTKSCIKNAFQEQVSTHEYPHTQRIRNLRRLIAEGKVKPESETLIFFLCNKFAVSDDRRKQFE